MANNFSGDSDCVSVWNFESGAAFLEDSKGSNDLTNFSGVDVDTALFHQGNASGKWTAADLHKLYIIEGDLHADHPYKSSATHTFTVLYWYYMKQISVTSIFQKSNSPDYIHMMRHDTTVESIIGYTGAGHWESKVSGGDFTGKINQWYHFAFSFEAVTKAYHFRIWDDNLSAIHDDTTGNFTNDIFDNAGHFNIGAFEDSANNRLEGNLDEFVIFKRILTSDEIDEIRAGTFSGGVSGNALFMGSNF